MGLIEREAEAEARRLAASREHYGHDGASIPGAWIDWRSEALSLEAQLAGAVDALREVRLYAEKMMRDREPEIQRHGADVLRIVHMRGQ
jgi:hypothetical protein